MFVCQPDLNSNVDCRHREARDYGNDQQHLDTVDADCVMRRDRDRLLYRRHCALPCDRFIRPAMESSSAFNVLPPRDDVISQQYDQQHGAPQFAGYTTVTTTSSSNNTSIYAHQQHVLMTQSRNIYDSNCKFVFSLNNVLCVVSIITNNRQRYMYVCMTWMYMTRV